MRAMKVSLVQLTSSNDLDANLRRMHELTREAARDGARIVVFPELAYFMGKQPEWTPLVPRYQEILHTFATWAKESGVYLLPGSMREPTDGPGRYFNTLPVIDPHGEVIASYRKIHLFRANLPDRVYSEGLYSDAGTQTAVFEVDGLKIGLAICYDLRFPELFRSLRAQGAQAFLLPASFTVPTGTAHWEVLLRARAIENQVFVLAPGQTGQVGDGAHTFGHTIAIAPWGEVLAVKADGEGLLTVDIEPSRIGEAAARVDCWRSRRDELFPIASPQKSQ